MSDANKAIVRRFYGEVSKGNLDVFDALVSDDFVEHELFPGLTPDKAGARQMFETLLRAFPDLELVPEDLVAEGDRVFVRATMRGTHGGEFMGVPATGRRVEVPVGDFLRVAGGKVVEHWGVTDSGALLQQLGALGPAT